MTGALWGRITLSVMVAAVSVAAGQLLVLPGLEGAEELVGETTGFSWVALGLMPLLSAYFLVEFVVWVVPRWRHLRIGGPAGRAKLRKAVVLVTMLAAAVQALGIAYWLETATWELALDAYGAGFRMTVIACLLAGFGGLIALVRWVDARGLGQGLAVVTAAGILALIPALVDAFAKHARGGQVSWEAGASLLLVYAGVAAATVAMLNAHRWLPRLLGKGHRSLRLPAAGLVPLDDAGVLVAWFGLLSFTTIDIYWLTNRLVPTDPLHDALGIGLLVGLAFVYSWAFNRPGRVAALTGGNARDLRRPLWVAAALSAIWLLGLALAQRLTISIFDVSAILSVTSVVWLAAIGCDLAAELVARRRHPTLVRVWPLHRVYAAGPALNALESAGIPALARGLHLRQLMHFFGPAFPIELMVPEDQAAAAIATLEAALKCPQPPTSTTTTMSAPSRERS